MPFDHRHYIDGNPVLKGFHDEMVRQYERAHRYRYMAEFLRELGHTPISVRRTVSIEECFAGQHALLLTAYEAHQAAEELHGLFGQLCSSRDDFTVAVQWPRPNVRDIDEQLSGERKEPYEYGGF